MQEFFLLLAVCNTVIVAKSPHRDSMNESGIVPNSAKIQGANVSAAREASSPSVGNTVSTQLDDVKEER